MKPTVFTEFIRTIHHKKLFRVVTSGIIVFSLPFVGAYSYFFAVKKVKLEHLRLKLFQPKKNLVGLKIAQISDLHFGPTNKNKKHFHDSIDLINSLHPDLIVLTGDYYQWDPDYLHELPDMLARLRAPLGIYGCLGNHDYGSSYPGITESDPFDFTIIREAFDRSGLTILANQSVILRYKGKPFNLVGLHDLWSDLFDPDEAFKKIDETLTTFVLSHNPDTIKLVNHDFDLMLCGHSHGGQISWPVVGPLTLPMSQKKYYRGFHQITEKKKLYINRGLGHTFQMRLNSPPEVTLIEIVE